MILSFKHRVEGPPYDDYKNASLSIKKTPKTYGRILYMILEEKTW